MTTYDQVPEPPKSRARRDSSKWRDVALAARRAMGDYIVLENERSVIASFINAGRYAAFRPAGRYEAVTRNNHIDEHGAKRATIYVRYISAQHLHQEPSSSEGSRG